MGRSAKTRCGVWLALVSLVLAWPAGAQDDAFKVIVHPTNPVTSVDRDFLRDAYLKKEIRWDHGELIRPVMLSQRHASAARFTQEVLAKSPSQLRAYWVQRIFTGRGTPPLEADSAASVAKNVLADVGAVGFVPIDFDSGAAKVVELR